MAASKGPNGPKRGHHRSIIIETAIGGSGGAISSSRQGSVDGAMQKCGLCSLLSRLLRRAMCVGSRRGSGESYYQELAETNVSVVFIVFVTYRFIRILILICCV